MLRLPCVRRVADIRLFSIPLYSSSRQFLEQTIQLGSREDLSGF